MHSESYQDDKASPNLVFRQKDGFPPVPTSYQQYILKPFVTRTTFASAVSEIIGTWCYVEG